jgi:hypothetical protein
MLAGESWQVARSKSKPIAPTGRTRGARQKKTGLPHPGEAGPSYHNIQRAGFVTAYVRPNLTRKS